VARIGKEETSDVEEGESTQDQVAQGIREIESEIESTWLNSGRSPSVELESGSQVESLYNTLVHEYGNWTVDEYLAKYGGSALTEVAQEPERTIERLAQGLIPDEPPVSLVNDVLSETDIQEFVADLARDRYQSGMVSRSRYRYDEAALHFWASWEAAVDSKDRLFMAHSSQELAELAEELGQIGKAAGWCNLSHSCYGTMAFENFEKGEYDTARQLRQQQLEMANKLVTLATSLKWDRIIILVVQEDVAEILRLLAFAVEKQGDKEECRKQLQISGHAFVKTQQDAREEGLERKLLDLRPDTYDLVLDVYQRLGDRRGQAYGLHWVGIKTLLEGKLDEARERFERSAELSDELLDHRGYAENLLYMGITAFYGGDLDKARELFKRALGFSTEMRIAKIAADSLVWLANVAFEQSEADEGRQRLRQSVPLYQRFELATMADKLDEFAELARKLDKPETAKRLEERGRQIAEFATPSYFEPSY
jgi:tetratricopeptide (TPR) repeat protein